MGRTVKKLQIIKKQWFYIQSEPKTAIWRPIRKSHTQGYLRRAQVRTHRCKHRLGNIYKTNAFSILLLRLTENTAKALVFDVTPIETQQN